MRRHHYPYKLKLDTGSLFVNGLTRVLTHLCVVLSATLAVLFVCDRFNLGEMSLLSNELTRWLLLALCVFVLAAAPLQLKALSRLRSMRRYEELQEKHGIR